MKWITDTLNKFPFVEWDRYIDDTDDKLIEVFGWIKDKEKEKKLLKNFELLCGIMSAEKTFLKRNLRKDFIVLEFDLKTKEVYCIATSSAKYSKQISKILGEKHISCKSVKDL